MAQPNTLPSTLPELLQARAFVQGRSNLLISIQTAAFLKLFHTLTFLILPQNTLAVFLRQA